MTFFIAFALVFGLMLIGRPLAIRLGVLDHPVGHKVHDSATPVIGGPIVFLAVAAAVFATFDLSSSANRVMLGVFPLMLLGLIDDLWRLRPMSRLIVQIAVVTQLMVGSGVVFGNLGAITGGEALILPGWAAYAFTLFALVGLINGINLVDGMDGLASGLSVIAVAFLLVLSIWLGTGGKGVVYGLAILGGLLAFMAFNMRHPWNPRASVFLGDSGSLLLGVLLGVMLARLTQPETAANPIPPVLGLWVLVIPVFDTCSVMIRRLVAGKSPLHPDRQHLHHLLMQAGLSHGQTVALLLALAMMMGFSAIIAWLVGVSESTLFAIYLVLAAAYLAFVIKPERAVAMLRSALPSGG